MRTIDKSEYLKAIRVLNQMIRKNAIAKQGQNKIWCTLKKFD